jgi:hypothetical protein
VHAKSIQENEYNVVCFSYSLEGLLSLCVPVTSLQQTSSSYSTVVPVKIWRSARTTLTDERNSDWVGCTRSPLSTSFSNEFVSINFRSFTREMYAGVGAIAARLHTKVAKATQKRRHTSTLSHLRILDLSRVLAGSCACITFTSKVLGLRNAWQIWVLKSLKSNPRRVMILGSGARHS